MEHLEEEKIALEQQEEDDKQIVFRKLALPLPL